MREFAIIRKPRLFKMAIDNKQVRKYFESAANLLGTSKTLQEIFLAATSLHAKDKAITYINEKGKIVSYKYKKYRTYCFETASKLSQKLSELPKNSVVGLKLKNCPDWPLLFWAILMNGFVPFLIDAKLPKENTETLIKESHAKAIITGEIFSYDILTVNVASLEDVKVNFKFPVTWANEVIFCSSGTTGNVKLMVFDGSNLCHQIAASLDMPNTTNDIMYPGEINIAAIIPFHHIFGFVAVFLWYTFYGKNIVFVKDLSPTEVTTTCQRCGVTHVYSVPLFWDSLAQSVIRKADLEGPKKADIVSKMIAFNTHKISAEEAGQGAYPIALSIVQSQLLGKKIRYCISGGGYISAETMNVINGIGYPLYNGYGMTEAGVVSVELSPKVEYRLKGSIGKPLHGVEFKLRNTTKLHPNVGELMIKSNITHKIEIINGVEQTPELIDGFMPTGDIASKDETGFYYIKGRIKDIIINENGENIYPDEIEDYFKEVKGVTNVCVVGVKKGKSTHEVITAIFEISNDCDEEKLRAMKEEIDKINNGLSNEKRVQDFFIAKEKLPLTASMKVKRFQVRELMKIKKKAFISFDEKKEIKTFEGYKKEDIEPIIKVVRKVFSKTLYLPEIKIGDDDHWINDLGGDSMSYIELIASLDQEFGVKIPEELYAKLTSVNEFTEEILILKGVKKSK